MFRQHILALQRHRAGHRRGGHRHRLVGHSRESGRPAVLPLVGRPGAGFRPPLLPPGWRPDGRLLRNPGGRGQPVRGPGPAGCGKWVQRIQMHGRSAHDADRGACADQGRGSVRAGDARARGAMASTSWSIATPGRRPPWAAFRGRHSNPYGLYFLEEPCWPEQAEGLAAIAAATSTPIATGERVTSLDQFHRLFSRCGRAVWRSRTSRTVAAFRWPAGLRPLPRPLASLWPLTTRKVP